MSAKRAFDCVLAEFETAEEMLEALTRLRARGYSGLETYSPYEVPGAAECLGFHRPRLPWLVFGGGVIGAVLSYAIQWYANAWDYPLNVGGRPAHAAPAFILATFEGMILLAALTAFFGLLVVLRLPKLWHPVFEIDGFERASSDRFWVAIDARRSHADVDLAMGFLEALHPLRVLHVEDAE